MNLDVESLRAFLAVLDQGGMTAASKRLNLSQSAVSRKILRLEDRIGRPLFGRDGHSLRLSRDGRALLPDARAIVELHDRAVARLQSSELSGTVRLGSNGEVDATQIASMLGRFKLRHPGADVEFVLDHSGQLPQWLDSGKLDLAIFQVGEQDLRSDDIVLWTEELSWATNYAYDFSDGVIPLVDFGNHWFYSDFSRGFLEAAGLDYRVVFSAESSSDVRAAVEAGIGIAVLATRYLGGAVVEWDQGASLGVLAPVYEILRSDPGPQGEAVAALVETIQDQLTWAPVTSEVLEAF